MPHRDDFEEFDKSVEGLVSQIGVKSLEDEDIDTALQLVHVDMYERLLREVRFFNNLKITRVKLLFVIDIYLKIYHSVTDLFT